jgi:Ca-activated chloride channel family protein
MSRPASLVLGVAACSLVAVLILPAQETVFKVSVRLVRILATVRNPSGELVGTLGKADFTVTDNGVPQQIAVFERQTEQPLSIALVVDHSLSTAKDLRYETESVSRFLNAVFSEGNPGDEVALYTFSYDVILRAGFTRRRERLEEAMRTLKAESGTSLYDAIYLVSRDVERREGRRVVVLVTDGGDTTSTLKFSDALEAAQLADVVLYAILIVPVTNDAGRNLGGENALAALAAGTAGRVFTPSVGPTLDAAFSDILKELRTQYFLGFYPRGVPPARDRFHRLEVRVSNPALRVTARSGYYEEVEPQSDSGSGGRGPQLKKLLPPGR